MLSKNIIPYVMHTPVPSEPVLREAMEGRRTNAPLSGSSARSVGWCNVVDNDLLLSVILDNKAYYLVAMLRRERLLPASVVKEEVEEKVAAIEAREERKVTRKEKTALKEQVTEALLPRAFVRSQCFYAWIDAAAQRIFVDASSRPRAEDLLDLLRETIGSLKVTPLNVRTLPHRAMTDWATEGTELPKGLGLGNYIELESKGDDGTITGRKVDLHSSDIQAALESGRMAEKLAIKVDGELSATLTSDLALKTITIADARIESSHVDDIEDARQLFTAEFIMTLTAVSAAYNLLVSALGGEAEYNLSIEGECSTKDTQEAAADHLYEDAVAHIRETKHPSISALQRQFKIAYTRASEIMLQLERNGIVGPIDENGRRHLLQPAA
ncbi:recombination-associated protein RdgC [Vreelandella alkaliphila]|uniref:Recombination-associated protein RdgC n=1 Tax=Vreelandella alkaliphila TaxID=272774 RepID=A0AAJ2S4I7_9GAMM|nr:recombination-associated protein RdgC [Halomonas alkaliphila]MDX5979598.1 recombination-associated protein RdgC [Halomonas alkaliphila]